jgi:hypothetical protein
MIDVNYSIRYFKATRIENKVRNASLLHSVAYHEHIWGTGGRASSIRNIGTLGRTYNVYNLYGAASKNYLLTFYYLMIHSQAFFTCTNSICVKFVSYSLKDFLQNI